MDETQIVNLKGRVSWADYKKIINPATSEFERCQIIDKYIGGDPETMSVRDVIDAFKRAMNEAANPNA